MVKICSSSLVLCLLFAGQSYDAIIIDSDSIPHICTHHWQSLKGGTDAHLVGQLMEGAVPALVPADCPPHYRVELACVRRYLWKSLQI